MSKSIVPLNISHPGRLGLNVQEAGGVLPLEWATTLNNFVYDKYGRLVSRKGSQQVNASAMSGTPTVRSMHEYVDAAGNTVLIFAGGNTIWKNVSGTITDISGSITTPTADNWQFANFNGTCVGYQSGHVPIVLTTTAGTFADATGTQYNGNMVLSAYGRLWTTFSNTLYYSDLLINNYTGGTSGSIDLSLYWPNGMDEAVALADFNDFLIVFGKKSIIIVGSGDDVTNLYVSDSIRGIGCLARDSIQTMGTDLLFLSATGVRSLGRVIQEKSNPIGDVSIHIRDSLLDTMSGENVNYIKSVNNREEGFYLLSFPTEGKTYCFDTKGKSPDGSLRVTVWDMSPTCLSYSQDLKMYMGVTDGYISEYTGYRDEDDSSGVGGSPYNILYESGWTDFGEEVSAYVKILKKIRTKTSGLSGSGHIIKWAVDYREVWDSSSLVYDTITFPRFGQSQFGVSRFAGGTVFQQSNKSMTWAGQIVKIGFQGEVNNLPVTLQGFDLMAKLGRLG